MEQEPIPSGGGEQQEHWVSFEDGIRLLSEKIGQEVSIDALRDSLLMKLRAGKSVHMQKTDNPSMLSISGIEFSGTVGSMLVKYANGKTHFLYHARVVLEKIRQKQGDEMREVLFPRWTVKSSMHYK